MVADWLGLYRGNFDEHLEPTENERLIAGHIVGRLWAEGLLNTDGEKWVSVNRETPL